MKMGLLTDPSAGQGKLTKALLRFYPKICALMYLAGLVWFCSLAYAPMNQATYFSENALLPGLVKSEFREDAAAKLYHEELLDEMKKYDNGIPYPWLLAKFKQIGLDTYTHNFTLHYPLGKPQKFAGKNVYGILRAARASSTEALVLSVPYRPPVSVHQSTAVSIAIMLAFAKFANKEKYWAKDVIFLITEHEQLGMQAWLEAYHGEQCGNNGTLEHGDLRGRAGAIQAAINLELHDIPINQFDLKIEGLNGQLPNLDLFNLAAKMCVKEGIYHTFKGRPARTLRDPTKDWLYSFRTLMAMVATQATGVPNGNHGLYHRFGIEALTIEGFGSATRGTKAGFLSVGRIIEGVFRSLNNLLERFHQSYFFYLLPSSERFVSIGLYMPTIGLLAGALVIKACAKWCQLQEKETDAQNEKDEKKQMARKDQKISNPPFVPEDPVRDAQFWKDMRRKFERELANPGPNPYREDDDEESSHFDSVIVAFLLPHLLGVVLMNSPQAVTSFAAHYGYGTEVSLCGTFVAVSVLGLVYPLFVPFKAIEKSMTFFNIFALLVLGTALACVAMTNFSLGLFIAAIYVPLALIVSFKASGVSSFLQKALWLLAHPLLVLAITVLAYTFVMFPGDGASENFYRGVGAAQQAIVYGIVDAMIYGNSVFGIVVSVFVPNWICFWVVACSRVRASPKVPDHKKTN